MDSGDPISIRSASASLESKALLDRARELLNRGQLQESDAAFRKVIALSIDALQGFYGLGVISLRRGDPTAAAVEFQKCVDAALAHGPQTGEAREATANAYYYLGEIWEKRSGPDVAFGFYRKALEINPDHRSAQQKLRSRGPIENFPLEVNQPAGVQSTSLSGSSAAAFAGIMPPQAGVYEYLRKDSSALAQQTLRLIDSLDSLGTITPRLSASLGSIAWRILAIFVVSSVLPVVRYMPLARYIGSVSDFTVLVESLIALSVFYTILRVKTTRITFDKGRLRISRGLLSREQMNRELYRTEDIVLHQTLANRLTGDGDLILKIGSGRGVPQTLHLLGLTGIDQLRQIADQLRNLVLLLRTGQFGKGIIY